MQKGNPLREVLEKIELGINNTVNRTTGYSPIELSPKSSILNIQGKKIVVSEKSTAQRIKTIGQKNLDLRNRKRNIGIDFSIG